MITITTEQISDMIGLRVRYRDVYCQVVEILEDSPAIILEDLEQHISIQPDQHGEAHRRVPKTYMIKILTHDKLEFSPDFLSLDPVPLNLNNLTGFTAESA